MYHNTVLSSHGDRYTVLLRCTDREYLDVESWCISTLGSSVSCVYIDNLGIAIIRDLDHDRYAAVVLAWCCD